MASFSMPAFAPPRTPTPTSSYDGDSDVGLGIDLTPSAKRQHAAFIFDLSPAEPMGARPMVDTNMLSPEFTPTISPAKTMDSVDSPMTPFSATMGPYVAEQNATAPQNPFNFTTQQYTAGKPIAAKADLGRRKGHKYKHSSISHQIFQAPAPRPALQLPTALPMPTRTEIQSSMTGEQKARLAWCLCHFAVAAYVQWSAHGSLAMTALSRLLFFDASGAALCVFVDLMSNFEVWKRSSLRHPFGLERADVLAGFGMAVFIAFMGLDVLSHGIEHALENQGSHVPHTTHSHSRVSPGSIDLAALLAIVSTVVSAVLLRNHARIGKAMRFELLAGWGKILGNPSHFMTLSCSTLLLLLPLMSIQTYTWFDTALSGVIALLMISFGARLGMNLASMLLMSYSGPGGVKGVKEVIAEIEADPLVSVVEEARFWQVHYGVGMANLKLRYRGSGYGDELSKMREKLTRLIRNRLGGEYGGGGLKWEVTTQLILEAN